MRIAFEFVFPSVLSLLVYNEDDMDDVEFPLELSWSMAETPICVRERVCTRFSFSVRSWTMRCWSVCTSLAFHPFHLDLYRLRRSSSRLVEFEFAFALFAWVYTSILRVCGSSGFFGSFGYCTRTSSGDAVMR